jgi:glycerol-3-phosphate acyltransferase PlsX
MKIVLDAMGSDDYPAPDVAGTVLAARELDASDEIILVGQEEQIQAELAKHDTVGLPLSVVHASEVIEMSDKPARAVKARPDSSVVIGMRLVKEGKADAFVSAGNTGGVLAAGLFGLGRIRGIRRPALAAPFPLPTGPVLFLDSGANADCRPEFLYQFGLMGSAYMEKVLGRPRPRVATLSNGEEEGKGNTLVKESFVLLRDSSLNFVGNVEPKEFLSGKADVVVTDGFTGNVIVKQSEAVIRLLFGMIRDELKAGALTSLGGLLARPAFLRVAKQMDPFEIGGLVLLGLRGVVVVAHGRSNEVAIKNAIRQAREAVKRDLVAAIEEGLAAAKRAGPEMSGEPT